MLKEMSVLTLPSITLLPAADKRRHADLPWIYANEINMTQAKLIPAGSLVIVLNSRQQPISLAYFNPHSLICGRVISHQPNINPDSRFWQERLEQALYLRQHALKAPFYRLIHAEADGFPGMIIDRFDHQFVVQLNTAASETLWREHQQVFTTILSPHGIVLRRDSPSRELEGLPIVPPEIIGKNDAIVRLQENQAWFFANLTHGQKTGWFFDQRDHRRWVAQLCRDKTVLDCYCFSGGFSVMAALGGAKNVIGIDRSAEALELAAMAARENKVDHLCTWQQQDVFRFLEGYQGTGFDIVIVDPPAFIKSKRDFYAGCRGYRKLAKLAAATVKPGGYLFFASCSHHLPPSELLQQLRHGLWESKRDGKIIYYGQAGLDHPVHPALPETAYLKGYMLHIF